MTSDAMSTKPERSAAADEGARRFLLTGVVSRYHHDPSWNREELGEDLHRIVELFTEDLGYRHVPVMGQDPTWLQIQDALRDFCTHTDRQSDDYVVVYLAGHGEILPVGETGWEHVLLPADAVPSDLRRRAVKSADLAEWMLADTPVRRLMLIVDACFSGQGGLDFARNALARVGTPARFDQPDGSGVVVVSATHPKQQARPGAFTTGFTRAVRHQASAGHGPRAVSIEAVLNVLKADPEVPATQQAQWSLLLSTGTIPDFLPNPRREVSLIDLDLVEQDRRWQGRLEQEHRRAEEMRGQFVPHTVGFLGRHRALSDIVGWLNDPLDTRPRIITGDPGSGKTAVLGLLAALADPQRRPTVPRAGLPPAGIPRMGAVDVAIYVGNQTTDEVLAGLAVAADVDQVDSAPDAFDQGLGRLLAGLRERDQPLVAIIDALDEASDPEHLTLRLLRPLIERSKGNIRLMLGTRRHICNRLGSHWQRRCVVIDLDAAAYADPNSLTAMVRRILPDGDPAAGSEVGVSPVATVSPTVLDGVTTAIAEAADKSFFVARILATTQASQSRLPNPADPAWRASLPGQAGPAMRRDLELRLGEQASRTVDLLRPLAYAQGAGLPWEDIWPRLANALSPGHGYTNEDLLWLRTHAGSYVVEGGAIEDQSVYRLYHRSLVEHLRAGRDQAADHHAITTALRRYVPHHSNGCLDWSAAHSYTRTYLATHAASAGDIDILAQDPGFLLAAQPLQLLAALDATTSTPARAAAGAYRRVLPALRRHPPAERPAYLGLSARCGSAGSLADRLLADGLDSRWRARWASWRLQHPHHQFTGHTGGVRSVTVGEVDGRPVAVSGSDDGSVRVWDLATGAAVSEPFIGHTGWVLSVAVGEVDGRSVVVSGSSDRSVRVWDLVTGAAVGEPFTGHAGWVRSVAVGEVDGRPVAVSGSDDGSVRVWDLVTGAAVGEPFTGHAGWVRSVAVGKVDGRAVAVSVSDDRSVRVWDLATGDPVGGPLSGYTGSVLSVAVGEVDGCPMVVSSGDDGTVRVWDLAAGTPLGEPFTGHAGWVRSVAVGEVDGRPVVVSGSSDAAVRVWDLATGTAVGKPFTGHTGSVLSVAVGEVDGRSVVVSGSSDRSVRVWDLITGDPVGRPFTGHTDWVLSVAVGEVDGCPVVVSGSSDATVRVWDLATGAPLGELFIGHTGSVRSVAVWEVDGCPVVVSGSSDRSVRVWDLITGDPVGRPFIGHTGSVLSVAVGEADGRSVVVSGSSDRSVRVWDLATGVPVGEPFLGHTGSVLSVAVGEADGRSVVVSGSSDRSVRVWDLVTGDPVGGPFTGYTGSVLSVAVGEADGRSVVVSGSSDRSVRVWDLATGAPLGELFIGHTDWVLSVAVWDVGGCPVVVSGSTDRSVRVGDLITGDPVGRPFLGHTGSVLSVAVGEVEGRPVVVSGSDDASVRVWDLATGVPVGEPFLGHTGSVLSVAVGEVEGRPVVVSGSDDASVRVWDLATGVPVGEPFLGHTGSVVSVAVTATKGRRGSMLNNTSLRIAIGSGHLVAVWTFSTVGADMWRPIVAPEVGGNVLFLALSGLNTLVVATELGIVVLELPR